MLHIGKQCSDPLCHLVDFLPFTCTHCKQSFCQEHYRVEAHKCPDYDESKFNRVAPDCEFSVRKLRMLEVLMLWIIARPLLLYPCRCTSGTRSQHPARGALRKGVQRINWEGRKGKECTNLCEGELQEGVVFTYKV